MKLSTSRRQDAQVKRERLKELCLKWKLERLDNDAIARKLKEEGIYNESTGEAYTPKYISSVAREALKEIADERGSYGKELAVLIENDLDTLLETWMPLATGEGVDKEGNPLPPSAKAAEIVRKCLADKSVLVGANAPVESIISVRVESALDGFVSTLREFMAEEHFEGLLAAIDKADAASRAYWAEQKQLKSGEDDILDVEVVE